ncbi:MAG TPA: TetR/AcrR family transcriptional regulator [Dehalococcoidia bacterium]|nr:TetR/AcrR family transcriptional regulator [Dehalococcoidia bacterium]
MPKVTEAHIEARKQQILEAAVRCFGRQGFHKATMQDICAESGLSPGALYRYFPSKEEIIEAMVAERRRQGFVRIEQARRLESTVAALEVLAGAFEEIEDIEGCAVDVELWGEAFRNPRIAAALRSDIDVICSAFSSLIRVAQERGDITPAVDPASVARIMLALFQGMVIQRSLDQNVDLDNYVQALKAMMTGRFWLGQVDEGGA